MFFTNKQKGKKNTLSRSNDTIIVEIGGKKQLLISKFYNFSFRAKSTNQTFQVPNENPDKIVSVLIRFPENISYVIPLSFQ